MWSISANSWWRNRGILGFNSKPFANSLNAWFYLIVVREHLLNGPRSLFLQYINIDIDSSVIPFFSFFYFVSKIFVSLIYFVNPSFRATLMISYFVIFLLLVTADTQNLWLIFCFLYIRTVFICRASELQNCVQTLCIVIFPCWSWQWWSRYHFFSFSSWIKI